MMPIYYLGIDIGGTKTAFGLFNENKKLVSKRRVPTKLDLSAASFFDEVFEQARSFVENYNIGMDLIEGIGIGTPSFINFATGHIVKTGSIPLLYDFPVRDYLHQKLTDKIPVVIDNDGNTAALGELRQGAGRDYDHFVLCLLSTGIGTGFIVNRELFRGSCGLAGESGHMLVSPMGGQQNLPVGTCGCNNEGCLNSWCSGKMIVYHVLRWLDEGYSSIISELAGGSQNITAEHIGRAYHLGDQLAIRALDQMTDYIAIWLYNMYVSLNINCLIFNGGLLEIGDVFLNKIEEKFHKYLHDESEVKFLKSELGSDAGLIGAMELLFSEKDALIKPASA